MNRIARSFSCGLLASTFIISLNAQCSGGARANAVSKAIADADYASAAQLFAGMKSEAQTKLGTALTPASQAEIFRGTLPSGRNPSSDAVLADLQKYVSACNQGDWSRALLYATDAQIIAIALYRRVPPEAAFQRARERVDVAAAGFSDLHQLSVAAFQAGRYSEASEYLGREFRAIEKLPDGVRGVLLNHAYTLQGEIYLSQGDLPSAENALSTSVSSPSAYGLAGPSMTLARKLLEAKDNPAELAYLEKCKSVWPEGRNKLDSWAGEIRAGQVPHFQP